MGPLRHSLAALTALVLLPLAVVALLVRPAWRRGLGERLGVAMPRVGTGAVWVHAASVGEVQAALRLVDSLRERGEAVLLSTTSLTGRGVARSARPELPSMLAPLDHPWCTARALDRVAPSALILVETELWPSWIRSAARRRIPVLIASGRISDRSLPRYQRLSWLLASTLRRLAAVGARSPEDAERFVALGVEPARVEVTGDLKLEVPAHGEAPAADLTRALAEAPYWVAGSTHPGEERAALTATGIARAAGHRLTLVVAPRHPEKREQARAALAEAGARCVLRSALPEAPLEDGEVLLLDTLGELAALYTGAAAAFVGGTLAPVGGHNLLEPLQAGTAVLFGPHIQNVRSHATLLETSRAGRQVADGPALGQALCEVLADPAATRAAIDRALAALDVHRGATARTLALLEQVRRSGPAAPG